MHRKLTIILVAFAIMQLATNANAEPRNEVGRYSMHKTDDGFIRLDTLTGAVSICGKADAGWSCRPMPDEARKLKSEIESLRQRYHDLARRFAAATGRPPPPQSDQPNNERPEPKAFRLPSEQEVDKALDYFESMLKKFQDRLKRLEREANPNKEKQL